MELGDPYRSRGARPRPFALVLVPTVLVGFGVVAFFVAASLAPSNESLAVSPTSSPSVSRPAGGGVPENQHPTAPPVSGVGSAHPFITNVIGSADGSETTVYSFVPGVEESGGTCTARLTISGQVREISGQAEVQVATTTCPPLVVSLAGLPSGTASLTVDYQSATTSGRSAKTTVEVP